ncbi:MAG: hypothetical protein AAGA77_10375, partial [Bacteroidota bacterium]
MSFNVGFTSRFNIPDLHPTIFNTQDFRVNRINAIRERNWTLSYTRFIDPANGIKFSYGSYSFGFYYNGLFESSDIRVNNRARYFSDEWSLSYVRRIPFSKESHLIFEPGLLFHSNIRPEAFTLSISTKNSFSVSTFVGVEIPLASNDFFINTGILVKLPIEKYNFTFNQEPDFYPYYIGVR